MSFLRTINDALIAARQPVSEDLKKRERDNALLMERATYTDVNGLMAGANFGLDYLRFELCGHPFDSSH